MKIRCLAPKELRSKIRSSHVRMTAVIRFKSARAMSWSEVTSSPNSRADQDRDPAGAVGDDRGGSRSAVDRGEFPEKFSGPKYPIGDETPGSGEVHDANGAGNEKVHVLAVVAPLDDGLAGPIDAPSTGAFDSTKGIRGDAREEANRCERAFGPVVRLGALHPGHGNSPLWHRRPYRHPDEHGPRRGRRLPTRMAETSARRFLSLRRANAPAQTAFALAVGSTNPAEVRISRSAASFSGSSIGRIGRRG